MLAITFWVTRKRFKEGKIYLVLVFFYLLNIASCHFFAGAIIHGINKYFVQYLLIPCYFHTSLLSDNTALVISGNFKGEWKKLHNSLFKLFSPSLRFSHSQRWELTEFLPKSPFTQFCQNRGQKIIPFPMY